MKTATERLYLTADRSRVVREGPDAAFLWKSEGKPITDEEAAQFGLDADEKAAPQGEDKAMPKAEDKSVAAPARKRRRSTKA